MLGDMRYSRDLRWSKSDLVLWLSVCALTLLLLAPLPLAGLARLWPALVEDGENFGHPVMGAWLAHLAFRRLRSSFPPPSPAPWQWSFILISGYGGFIEILQHFTGRDASLTDFMNDVLGAGFALLLHARAAASSPWLRRGLLALAAAAGVAAAAPLTMTLAAYAARSVQAPVVWNEHSRLLKRFWYWKHDDYPGLVIDEPLPDWRQWNFLELKLANPQPLILHIVVRVHDREHDRTYRDRYNGRFTLPPQSNQTVLIPLEEIRTAPQSRQLDMSAIRGVIVFELDKTSAHAPLFQVSQIRLVHQESSNQATETGITQVQVPSRP